MAVLQYDDDGARRLEAIYTTSDVVAQRRETLRRLRPGPGEAVIDIGCGPGLLSEGLAEAVGPGGRVLGLDVSPAVIAMAARRCAVSWASFRVGDAQALGEPDAAFDVAVSTQVLEYVADVDRALGEMFRVLRPGGRALIVDTDWDTAVWHTEDPDRLRRVLRAWEAHGTDVRLPRTLAPRLRRAGFAVTDIGAYPIVNPELHPDTYSHGAIDLIAAFVATRLPPDEVRAWQEELHRLGREGRYFFSLNRYFFAAAKPDAAPTRRG